MKKISKQDKVYRKEQFMTEKEMLEVNDRIDKLNYAKGDMSALYTEWSDIEDYYKNEQPETKGRPNTKVNVMNANIEGQVAMIIDQNIAVSARGEGAGDQEYADMARIGLDWTLRKNRFKKVLEQHERRRLKFGNGMFHVYFDPDDIQGFGLTKVCCVSPAKFYIDGKVKDPLKFQDAEWMAEVVRVGKQYVEEYYGEDKASAVDYGNIIIEDTTVFQETTTEDDLDAAVIIKWWERHKGQLRLLEFSGCGVLLYDSHKKGERTDNQKNAKYEHKPYYKYVNNKYPYFLTILYQDESNLWGFGDGKLLMPLQRMINELYDKIRICARPNLMLYDINSDIDLEDYAENSLEPRPFDGTQTKGQPVYTAEWGQINPAWWQLLNAIHTEIQRVTRFSGLMTGQNTNADSATEAAIQQQQGNSATNHKKSILQETLVEMLEYMLGVMIEMYTEGRTIRVSEDKDEYEYIDFRKMANVPVKIPASREYAEKYKAANPDASPDEYKWELLTEGKKPMTKNIDLDIEVSIGAGLPKNPTFLYQMAEKLSQMAIPNAMGQPQPVVSWEEMRDLLKKFLNIPLMDNEEAEQNMGPMMPGMPPMGAPMAPHGAPHGAPQGAPQAPMQSADAPLSMNSAPQMTTLASIRGGSPL